MKQKLKNYAQKRKITVFLLILFLLCVIICTILIFLLSKSGDRNGDGNSTEETSALLVELEGEVFVVRDEREIQVDGEREVFVGDTVKTNDSGKGYIIFSDNSSITLDTKTTIEINAQEISNESFGIKVKQTLGRTWSRVETLLGKSSKYEVETPNTIAAVRGTQFECTTLNDSVSNCRAIEHDIDLTLKSKNNEKTILNEGQIGEIDNEKIGNQTLDEIKQPFTLGQSEWAILNQCLTRVARTTLGEQKIEDFLKDKDVYKECLEGESNQITPTPTNAPTITSTPKPTGTTKPTATPTTPPQPTINTVNDGGTTTASNDITCSWTASNATSYKYSISDSPGAANILSWQDTTSTTGVGKGLKLSYAKTYYCNVQGFSQYGQTPVKSSDGILYDASAAAFRSVDPTNGDTYLPTYGKKPSGTGAFSGMPIGDVGVKFYIRRSCGKLCYQYAVSGDTWQSGIRWHYPTVSGTTSFSFASATTFGPSTTRYNGALVHYELYNKRTGKTFPSITVTLGNAIVIF